MYNAQLNLWLFPFAPGADEAPLPPFLPSLFPKLFPSDRAGTATGRRLSATASSPCTRTPGSSLRSSGPSTPLRGSSPPSQAPSSDLAPSPPPSPPSPGLLDPARPRRKPSPGAAAHHMYHRRHSPFTSSRTALRGFSNCTPPHVPHAPRHLSVLWLMT